ncbi:MAG TPA: M56 family metallopeptidase [Clostridiales bacterium]|nr:M56 family metallopeptidase [Clostridiales bacterium]
MNEIIKLILSLSLSGSILAVLIFAVKPVIKHRLTKSIQYYIWIVVLLRFLLPFSFEGSIMNKIFYGDQSSWTMSNQTIVQPMNGTSDNKNNTDNSSDFSDSHALSTLPSSVLPNTHERTANGVYNNDVDHGKYFKDLFFRYALYLWLIGAILAITNNLAGYARFLRHLKQTNKPATEEQNIIFNVLLRDKNNTGINIGNNVRLVCNRFVTTPMLVGILKPCIIIPDIDFDDKQLENILLHEITHSRHFDIVIKWLTMIAASIHWFNPLIYLIKKEINHACELACDETVIKNLSLTEKQAYGDTLISVVAEHKYPVGVLQATMCEEKKSLKERLIAIMNHNKKSKYMVIFAVILLGIVTLSALYLGAGIGTGKDTPYNIYISAENSETKAAQIGTYSWSYRGTHIEADSDHPMNFEYRPDNIIAVEPEQQLIISTQKIKSDRKYNFSIEQISVYKDKQMIQFESVEPSLINGNLYIQAPPDVGEYIYTMILNFKDKGSVNYGFVVRAGMLTYDLDGIAKYKTPYIGDASKVGSIVSHLPVPDSYFKQQYISMETSKKPYGLTIYYEAASNSEYNKYKDVWPITASNSVITTNLRANALVTFCLIDNLDEVAFAFRNSQSGGKLDKSKYDSSFVYTRAGFEEEYGDLSALAENLDLLKEILTEKKTVLKGKELANDLPMPEFSDEEVAAALTVVEEYFRAIAAKDDETILATMYPREHYTIERVKSGNVQLYGAEIRTLLTIDYDSQDNIRRIYRPGNHQISEENIIVFRVSFKIQYPLKDGIKVEGPWHEGIYDDWNIILIRDNQDSPWLIYDQGY